MPGGQETGEGVLLDRLDLATQGGQRPAAERAEHFGLTPFALGAPGPELASHDPAGLLQPGQGVTDPIDGDTEASSWFRGGERSMRRCVPREQIRQRVIHRVGERGRQTHRQRTPDGIPVPRGIFGRGVADLIVDPNLDGPVTDALDMIQKLSESERVEQVFVRHAFRFWMGRNETLHDREVIQQAHAAYRDSGGSMKALITSLVSSDAFLYRTRED